MSKLRFYPISYHLYEERGNTNIIIFAYKEDGLTRIALRIQYHHQFYVEVGNSSLEEVNTYLSAVDGAGIDGDILTMTSSVDLHKKIRVVSILASNTSAKHKAIDIFTNRDMPVHGEDKYINPVIKLIVEMDMKRYAWMQVDVAIPSRRVTRMNDEYIARYKTLSVVTEQIAPPSFSILSLDIETDSQNTKKMPHHGEKGSAIRLACITLVHGDRYEEHSLVYGPNIESMAIEEAEKGKMHIPNLVSKVYTMSDELELVMKIFSLITELDPDIIIGHNHLGFDIPFIVGRMRYLIMSSMKNGNKKKLSIPNISRVTGYTCSTRESNFNSSAMSISSTYIDAPGRIWIDTMILSIRSFFGNMPDNKLGTLASTLLGMKKDDVTAQDMFSVYRLTEDNEGRVREVYSMLLAKHNIEYPAKNISSITAGVLNRLISTINITNQRGKKKRLYRAKDMKNIDAAEEYEKLRHEAISLIDKWNITMPEEPSISEMIHICWWIITKYCIQDTRIPYQLVQQQGIVQVMCEQASIYNVNIYDLIGRGSVYKVNSSMYGYHNRMGVMMDFGNSGGPTGSYKYEGGHVAHVDPGLKVRDNDSVVIPLDFSSLYPTTIIAYNLCHTTWVPPDMRDPKSDDYIWKRYENDLIHRSDDPDIMPILDAPYEERGRLMCDVFTIHNSSTNLDHVHWFVKKSIKEGVVPNMLWEQYNKRKEVRSKIKVMRESGNEAMAITYNAQQLAIKIAMNSAYGAFGTSYNRMANFPVAETICYIGRESILACNKYVKDEGIGEVVYNDTDSAMILISDIKKRFNGDVSLLESYCIDLAQQISKRYKKPMMLDYEGIVMSLLVKAPKMYAFIECDGRSLDIDDYNRDYIDTLGLMSIKGMAPARRDKYQYNKILITEVLCRIMLRENVGHLIAMLERAISNIWALKNRRMSKNILSMFSYNMGVTAKALQGGSSVMGSWAPIYREKYGRTIPAGERFDLLVSVGSNKVQHTKAADKMVTYDWFIEENRSLDVIHYIGALSGSGNVVELLNLAYPDEVPRDSIQRYYLPTLRLKDKI